MRAEIRRRYPVNNTAASPPTISRKTTTSTLTQIGIPPRFRGFSPSTPLPARADRCEAFFVMIGSYHALASPGCYSQSSMRLGQSSPSSRAIERSLRTFPPVWHFAQ